MPREQSAELIDRLLADSMKAPDAEIEQAWKTVTHRRIAEIESGIEPGVPGQQTLAELRRVVGR